MGSTEDNKNNALNPNQIICLIFLLTFMHFTYALFDETGLLKITRIKAEIRTALHELEATQRTNAMHNEKIDDLLKDHVSALDAREKLRRVYLPDNTWASFHQPHSFQDNSTDVVGEAIDLSTVE